MSLDTVLKIGKALRSADNSLKYFKYVESPKDKDGNYPLCLTIPVKEDFSFDWDNVKITPEKERDNLYYLNFKTSDSDSSARKYLFGDILYSRKREIDKNGDLKEAKDFGNFTLEKGNAFENAKKVVNEIKSEFTKKTIASQLCDIEEEARIPFIKSILRGAKGEPIKLSKKVNHLSDNINKILGTIKNEENKIALFKFHKSFTENLLKFKNILLYALAIEAFLSNGKTSLLPLLQDENKLKQLYVKTLLEKHLDKVKNLFQKNEKPDVLSEATKDKLAKFANHRVFIHFDFGGKQWNQLEESFSLVKEKLNKEITDITERGIVPSKSIYRTLCSGNDKNDIQFPSFDLNNRYKSFAFKDSEEFEDFLYTDKFLDKPFRKLYGTDIDFYIFPVLISKEQKSISAKDYEDFFFEMKDENRLLSDSFSFIPTLEKAKFTKFDFVFADSGGQTINDLVEISGIEKSKLKQIKEQHENIAMEINKERNLKFEATNEYILKPENSFTQLLGKAVMEENPITKKPKVIFQNKTKTSKGYKPVPKYQSHLLKVLPLIYAENYYHDAVLLPSFIQNIEYATRAGDNEKYRFLKFHLMFLLKIQNNKNDQYMEILKSPSYQIGVKLGKLAKPLKDKINPFEKRYVGLLTRHINTKDDCIKFTTDIYEMRKRHEIKWGNQMSAEVNEELAHLPLRDYDREKLAFGFFEGYFKYEANDKKKDFFSRLEKLLTDYESNEELQETVDQFNELLDQIKTETTT